MTLGVTVYGQSDRLWPKVDHLTLLRMR